MAKRSAAAKKLEPEDNMEAAQTHDPQDPNEPGDPVDPQPNGDEPGQEQPQGEQLPARDFDAEEAELKAKLAALKSDKKAANKANGTKAPKAKKAPVERPPKDEANGVTRPGTGVTKQVWDTADMLSQRLGTYVDRATLTEVLSGKVEIGTIHTQYGRWRKYYGLVESADQRKERMAQIRAKKLEQIGVQPGAEPTGEQQPEGATQ